MSICTQKRILHFARILAIAQYRHGQTHTAFVGAQKQLSKCLLVTQARQTDEFRLRCGTEIAHFPGLCRSFS